jgi:DNA polymerase-3 subunit delta'
MGELIERNRRAAEVTGKKLARARATAGVKDLEERQRRAERRQRTDELRFGLATLASAYRDRLRDGRRRVAAIEAVAQIDKVVKSLEYNPGELLALRALLVRLGRIALQG